ncbi:NADPH-dependent FMN reductase [Nocardiopsis sp. NPDC049922]|uniref:NADPH-dependent FMN reductase n=1 Tax=Nocardiopsis sp. NPDC049922 TaxID=3155157 RepID=UPI0033CBD45C
MRSTRACWSPGSEDGSIVHIVGVGGSVRAGSSTEQLVGTVLAAVEERSGARTRLFGGPELAEFTPYDPRAPLAPGAKAFVEAVREADAVVIGSPAYHGSVSGLVKNALDHLEELRDDVRPYLDGRPVGLVTTAHGWQAAVNTLTALRGITHSLRGWPTPLGIAANVAVSGPEHFASPPLHNRVIELGRQLTAFPGGRSIEVSR